MSHHRAAQRVNVIGRPSRRVLVVLTALLVVAGTTWFSGASFTSGSSTITTVRAADDYYPPKVTVTSPGSTVQGVVAVSATASDTGSGVKDVVVQYAAVGSSTWTTLCTDASTPYSCTWDTAGVADGDYQLRAIATDNVGKTTTSAVATTKVANPAAVDLATINDVVRGTVGLSATVTGQGSRTLSSTFQVRVSGTTQWSNVSTACSNLTGSTPSCSWTTTGAEVYDVRVQTVVGSGGAATTVTDEQLDVTVDNIAPTVTVATPSTTTMSGTVQVTATPLDDDSGVAQVELSYKRATASTWTTLCTVQAEPYRCALDTTKLDNGFDYDLRATATDVAGNVTTSTAIRRRVDNGLASITITSPVTGDQVTGTRTITTDYATPLGQPASSVLIEARLVGGAFNAVCTDNTAPYSCDWSTTSLTSGTWELRATMTYNLVLSVQSPVVTVTIDNNPLRALDIQAANGGTLGKAGAGDVLTYTYLGAVDLGTIQTGWTGSSTAITMTLTDKSVAGTLGDRMTASVPLGSVVFAQNYIKNKSVQIPATMTATNGTSGGQTTTIIRVVLGSVSDGALRTSSGTGSMRWTPLASVKNAAGFACSTTPATETGATDKDL